MKTLQINQAQESWIVQELSVLKDIPPQSLEWQKINLAKYQAELNSWSKSTSFYRRWRRINWSELLSLPMYRKDRPMMSLWVAISLFLALAFGGVGATVYAAQSSLPDQALYPVKLMSEEARLVLAGDSLSQMNLNLEFANRRLDEMTQRIQTGQTPLDETEKRLESDLDDAVRNADNLTDTSQQKTALENLKNNLTNHQAQLARLQTRANPHAVAEFTRLVAVLQLRYDLAVQGIKDPNALQQRMEQQKEQIKQQFGKTMPPSSLTGTPRAADETNTSGDAKDLNDKDKGKGKNKEKDGAENAKQVTAEPDAQLSLTPEPTLAGGTEHKPPLKTPKNNNYGNSNGNGNGNGNNE